VDDPLSDVLAAARLKSSQFFCTEAEAPWGLGFRAIPTTVRWHYIARGSCCLSVAKGGIPRIAASGGDLLVLARGHGHSLQDNPRSPIAQLEDIVSSQSTELQQHIHLATGTVAGAKTFIATGSFELEDLSEMPILSALPPVISVTPDVHTVPSFVQNLQFITREAESNRPGLKIVLRRMADVIFVQILRAYIEGLPETTQGFLGALRDPRIAAALGLIHGHPEEAWTVSSLAERSGLSRSPFAARFARLVGEAPLGYLTRVRMQKAVRLLRGGATLAKVAEATGYASETSFSHAFRQWAGSSPGAYRRSHRSVAGADDGAS